MRQKEALGSGGHAQEGHVLWVGQERVGGNMRGEGGRKRGWKGT